VKGEVNVPTCLQRACQMHRQGKVPGRMMTQYEVSLSLAIMSESVPPSFAAVPCPPSCDTDFIIVPIEYGLSIEIKYVKKRIIIIKNVDGRNMWTVVRGPFLLTGRYV
jgi:hypothetical protein